jgi:hypothetical protein
MSDLSQTLRESSLTLPLQTISLTCHASPTRPTPQTDAHCQHIVVDEKSVSDTTIVSESICVPVSYSFGEVFPHTLSCILSGAQKLTFQHMKQTTQTREVVHSLCHEYFASYTLPHPHPHPASAPAPAPAPASSGYAASHNDTDNDNVLGSGIVLDEIYSVIPELRDLAPIILYHVLEVMICIPQMPEFHKLDPVEQNVLWWGALLHDVSKALLNNAETGKRIRDLAHPFRCGASAARILYRFGWTKQPPTDGMLQTNTHTRTHAHTHRYKVNDW